MSGIWSPSWWKDTAERMVASGAGGALTILGTNAVNITELDLGQVAAVAAGTALVSLLKALAATATTGTPAAFGVATPTGDVVEKVVHGAVVAGPANDRVDAGEVVRGLGRDPGGAEDPDTDEPEQEDPAG